MKNLILKSFVKMQSLKRDTKGQDLIEYALMVGFVSLVAGAIMPGAATSISTIFQRVTSLLSTAASNGG